jgi:hypothetical protein
MAESLNFDRAATCQIKEKKNDFDHAVLYFRSASPIVGSFLSQLKSSFDEVITSIEGRVPSTFESIIANLGSELDGWFTTTSNAYAGSSFISLPSLPCLIFC